MINPIETHYAGCRFRSRLEARYAVFFDTLGIKWEYEREGYEINDRLGLNFEVNWHYLPDFWLPEFGVHVEVKGQFDTEALTKFLSSAAYLSCPGSGCGGGYDSLIMGPLPRADRPFTYPAQLHMHKGGLYAYPFSADRASIRSCIGRDERMEIANDGGNLCTDSRGQALLAGLPGTPNTLFQGAYRAARSARFEHGEKG